MSVARLGWSTFIILLFGTALHAAPLRRFEFTQIHMGVAVRVTLYAGSKTSAETAARAAFDQFAAWEDVLSDYRRDSELSRLNSQAGLGPVKVSRELLSVLVQAQAIAELTSGAFDVTCGPAVQLWRQARKTKTLPDESSIQAARRASGHQHLILNRARQTAELKLPGMKLDAGGIGKGVACDAAIEAIERAGVTRAMVEAGGDLALSGPPPGQPGWRIGIQNLRQEPLVLKWCAVSTSGDSEQFVEIGGVRYSHVLDPRTGIGLTNRRQVTVIGPRATDTDALATAACVLGPEAFAPCSRVYRVRALWLPGPG